MWRLLLELVHYYNKIPQAFYQRNILHFIYRKNYGMQIFWKLHKWHLNPNVYIIYALFFLQKFICCTLQSTVQIQSFTCLVEWCSPVKYYIQLVVTIRLFICRCNNKYTYSRISTQVVCTHHYLREIRDTIQLIKIIQIHENDTLCILGKIPFPDSAKTLTFQQLDLNWIYSLF